MQGPALAELYYLDVALRCVYASLAFYSLTPLLNFQRRRETLLSKHQGQKLHSVRLQRLVTGDLANMTFISGH